MDRQPSQGLSVKLLHGLAALMAPVPEPWSAPSHKAWSHLTAYRFGSKPFLTPSTVWVRDLLVCVDGVRDVGRWRVGALVPFFGVCSCYPPQRKYASQQTTELHVVAWALRLAVRVGMSSVTVQLTRNIGSPGCRSKGTETRQTTTPKIHTTLARERQTACWC